MLTALTCLVLALQKPPAAEPPRLVVIVAVDQMVPDQLRRLAPRLTGGFRRFLDEGAVFWNATVDYAATETGPGHATLGTGRFPASHGIVGNVFFDDHRQPVYCVADGAVHPVTSAGVDEAGGGSSPTLLLGDGLADLLRARAADSKSVAVAGKDRSAVLLGGQHPDTALWWDAAKGGFTSSTYYGVKLPEFVGVWNAAWAERARGWKWERSTKDDLDVLGTAPDDRVGEVAFAGRSLPRTLPTNDAVLPMGVLNSPLVDYFTLELAMLAVDAEELGRDDSVDYLGISLSACDILGHGHGPTSVEVTDLLLRDDLHLGRLFEHLDESVGKGRWVACLSADHGVLGLPESLQAQGIGARRVQQSEVTTMQISVRDAIAATYPEAGDLGLQPYTLGFTFDETLVSAAGIEPAELRALIAEVARETKWVDDAYPRETLESRQAADPWIDLYRRSYVHERCPDVTLRPAPWLLFELPQGTSHGSPYPYDRGVPLAFLGGKIKPQQRFDAVSTVDAVPTLLGLLGIPAPADLSGRALKVE